ncbi:MAG: Unknown protein [uncultured Sulfurovum sp.]|uniref:Uncharacterized protein n=1 Tax=uncultured Sulfurovum sp. TaxID=269237 RepID=A0A6S6TC16_9BACT|nr:MAG: Unknown protein [uncultured Sulfurovum sp.]
MSSEKKEKITILYHLKFIKINSSKSLMSSEKKEKIIMEREEILP